MIDSNCYDLDSDFRANLMQKLLDVKNTLHQLGLDFCIINISVLNNKSTECFVKVCATDKFTFDGQKLLQDMIESELTNYILVGAMVNEGFILKDMKNLSFIFR